MFHLICTVAILMTSPLLVSEAFAAEPTPALKTIVDGNTTFALDLYSILKKEKGNLFFSPYSISSALTMTYGGARGDTAKELAKTLHFTLGAEKTHLAFTELNMKFDDIQNKGNVHLHIANSLWPQKDHPFLPEYLTLLERYYGVAVTPVDYMKATEKACKIINAWVEDRTKGKIKDLIGQGVLNPLTVLVLVNAIYFKGNWASQFDPKHTTESDFSLLDGGRTRVSMMYQKGSFGYGEIEGAQLLELPYTGNQLSMILILPNEPKRLSILEDELTPANLDSYLSRIVVKDVDVFLPKFKVTWGTFELKGPLQALGIQKAFSSGADFSGMDGTRSLSIDSVLHKAFVEVNEEGTEAAAATAVIMTRGGSLETPTFRADHPFLFLIRDKTTGSILFLGRILDPSAIQN